MTNLRRLARSEEGQTTVEYLLMLSIVVAIFLVVNSALRKANVTAKLMAPIKQDFARAYQYGHPKAKGYDDGGPEYHPRVEVPGNNNFRIFMSPGLH